MSVVGSRVDTWHLDDFQMPDEARIDYVRRSLGSTHATPPDPLGPTMESARTHIKKMVDVHDSMQDWIKALVQQLLEHKVYLPVDVWKRIELAKDTVAQHQRDFEELTDYAFAASEFNFSIPHMRYRFPF